MLERRRERDQVETKSNEPQRIGLDSRANSRLVYRDK